MYYVSRNLHKGLRLRRPKNKQIVITGLIVLSITYLCVLSKTSQIEKKMDDIVDGFWMGEGKWRGSEWYINRIKQVKSMNMDKYFMRVMNEQSIEKIKQQQKQILEKYEIQFTKQFDETITNLSQDSHTFYSYLTSQRLVISLSLILSTHTLFYIFCLYLFLTITFFIFIQQNKLSHICISSQLLLILSSLFCAFFLSTFLSQLYNLDQQNILPSHSILKKLTIQRQTIQCLNEMKQFQQILSIKPLSLQLKPIIQQQVHKIYTEQLQCENYWKIADKKVQALQKELENILKITTWCLLIVFVIGLTGVYYGEEIGKYQVVGEMQVQMV